MLLGLAACLTGVNEAGYRLMILTNKQKKSLLQVARKVIEATVKGEPVSMFESEDPLFKERCGCFVTIHDRGRLRGCIGVFQADKRLLDSVREMAVAAVAHDPRFAGDRVRADELGNVDVEISVLSPLVKTDDPLSLKLGKHGIYIKQGAAGGCFLPQVATETGWSKEEFLGNCCASKAGLAYDAWRDEKTEVLLFTAEVFGEKDSA